MSEKPEKETRNLVLPVTVRATDKGVTVTGYAAVFNQQAEICGWFDEVVDAGAFSDSLRNDDIRALFDHDCGRVLGRNRAGTLRLSEDRKGLAVEIDLPNTTDGNDVRELVTRGDVTGMSFCAYVLEESWDYEKEPALRTITKAELVEVSIVTFPAYEGTSVSVRSKERARERPEGTRREPHFNPAETRRRMMERNLRSVEAKTGRAPA